MSRSLIRLAASLPKGSPERRSILSRLKKADSDLWADYLGVLVRAANREFGANFKAVSSSSYFMPSTAVGAGKDEGLSLFSYANFADATLEVGERGAGRSIRTVDLEGSLEKDLDAIEGLVDALRKMR